MNNIVKKLKESRDFGGLTITIPMLLKNTKNSKIIFWGLCDDLYQCGLLKERYVSTIALCSNALYEYYYYSAQIEDSSILDADGKPSVYFNLRNNAENRYLKYVDKLGLTPRSALSLKLSDEEAGEELNEQILD